MTRLTETRHAYGEALLELGSQRSEVVVLDADLYKSTFTVLFRDAFPGRFFDFFGQVKSEISCKKRRRESCGDGLGINNDLRLLIIR